MLSLRNFRLGQIQATARRDDIVDDSKMGARERRATKRGTAQAAAPLFTGFDYHVARLFAGLCLGVLLLDVMWLPFSPIDLRLESLWQFDLQLGTLASIAAVYTFFRPVGRIAVLALVLIQVEVFSILGVMLSYLVIGLGRPLGDDFLSFCDQWLGFDWGAYAAVLRGDGWRQSVFGYAYKTIFAQILLVMLVFGFTDRRHDLYRLAGTLAVGMLLTVMLASWMPAVGAYLHYGRMQFGPASFGGPLLALHDGKLREIDFAAIHGVITFPSYHTVLSLALVLASWPSRLLRYPVLAAQALVILSVPAFGEHYLSDVIVGAGVALASDWLWRRAMGYAAAVRSFSAQEGGLADRELAPNRA